MSDSPEEVAAAALLKHEPPYPDVNGVYDCCASAVVAALREAGYLPERRTEEMYGELCSDGITLALSFDGTGEKHTRTVYEATPWVAVDSGEQE